MSTLDVALSTATPKPTDALPLRKIVEFAVLVVFGAEADEMLILPPDVTKLVASRFTELSVVVTATVIASP